MNLLHSGGVTTRGRVEVKEGSLPKVTLHERLYDLDLHITDMDEAGIDTAVLSCVLGWDATLEECRLVNDKMAEAQQLYPGRFVGLAHIPAHDQKASLSEVKRAVNDLNLKGVALTSQILGRALDRPEFFSIYETIVELDIPIFVHPAMAPQGYELAQDHDLGRILVREFDLCLASTRLIAGGVLERFPALRFVIAHFGGGIAAVKERIAKRVHRFDRRLTKSFDEYFNMLYFDMAGFEGGEVALGSALLGISCQRLVFATDYPQDFTGVSTSSGSQAPRIGSYIAAIRNQVSPSEAEDMLGKTAARLLKL
ncbi:amidohydrolase family protein [Acidobacteria bacterium AH-259-D05]|nr:amidohydrolase family protein [Acidobacteria bacterium AH-259-D05]